MFKVISTTGFTTHTKVTILRGKHKGAVGVIAKLWGKWMVMLPDNVVIDIKGEPSTRSFRTVA